MTEYLPLHRTSQKLPSGYLLYVARAVSAVSTYIDRSYHIWTPEEGRSPIIPVLILIGSELSAVWSPSCRFNRPFAVVHQPAPQRGLDALPLICRPSLLLLFPGLIFFRSALTGSVASHRFTLSCHSYIAAWCRQQIYPKEDSSGLPHIST